ncbi:hypothetical protein PISMIDRAFT_674724 [Pisolithus microcarpus 441]|uniref:Unplaced genomic scaffold scaffold_12, whole genome shotgun sequence n=1 Tax=Pisolithus microcarpus 441 TaxID=765257 RepID=A0A0C9ZDH8_9AGAM|nr:hypothetical protein PISMIDRAFT_674724 [Pisolithus microcarpus 441]
MDVRNVGHWGRRGQSAYDRNSCSQNVVFVKPIMTWHLVTPREKSSGFAVYRVRWEKGYGLL